MEQRDYPHLDLTRRILRCAYDIHRILGPGLLESTYKACLARELTDNGFDVRTEVPIPIQFRGLHVETSYRADLTVNTSVLIELKAVDRLLPIHDVQALTYLRHSRLQVALLINFNVHRLRFGVHRFART
jgi:GxxExxY protein